MGAVISLSYPQAADAAYLAAHLRQSDKDELAAVCDLSPAAALEASLACADPEFLFAAFADGQLLGIGGASPTGQPGVAAPWLLATPALQAYAWSLTRLARRQLSLMLVKYPLLRNVIDQRQQSTLRWLQSLGFSLEAAGCYRPGLPLWRFEMRR